MRGEMIPEFSVNLGENVKMSDAARQRIAASVQKAVLAEVARYDFGGDLVVRFPVDWLGIWLDGPYGPIVFDEPRYRGL